jgi:hypothetical protein
VLIRVDPVANSQHGRTNLPHLRACDVAKARPMASISASRTLTLRTSCLILEKAVLYGVQVRRIGGQEHKICPSCFDELCDSLCPVRPPSLSSTTTCPSQRDGAEVLNVGFKGLRESVAPSMLIDSPILPSITLERSEWCSCRGFWEPYRRPSSLSEPEL